MVMQKILPAIFLVIIIGVIAFFVLSGSGDDQLTAIQFGKDADNGHEIPFTRVADGYYPGFENDTERIITESNEWRTLWNSIHQGVTPRPYLPSVDFENDQIIGVFKGVANNFDRSIKIVKVVEGESYNWIVVETTTPGKACPKTKNTLLGQPYFIIKTELLEKPIQFHYKEVINECI